jgi:hypothetical protein
MTKHPLSLRVQKDVYQHPRRGHAPDESEDAVAVAPNLRCFALADGASESTFARLWARLLVKHFINQPIHQPQDWETWLPFLQECWQMEIDSRKLSWYSEAKAASGAFATLLGLRLSNQGPWRAVAVGDTCLFQLRDGRLHTSFPLKHAEEFDSYPCLIGSRMSPDDLVAQMKQGSYLAGTWLPGDHFLLMTDALAEWFLRQCEAGSPVEATANILLPDNQEAFAARIEELRESQGLRDDDVTLLHLHFELPGGTGSRQPSY